MQELGQFFEGLQRVSEHMISGAERFNELLGSQHIQFSLTTVPHLQETSELFGFIEELNDRGHSLDYVIYNRCTPDVRRHIDSNELAYLKKEALAYVQKLKREEHQIRYIQAKLEQNHSVIKNQLFEGDTRGIRALRELAAQLNI